MNDFAIKVTKKDCSIEMHNCPLDLDMRLIDNDSVFISTPDFIDKVDVVECRVIRKSCPKNAVAEQICIEHGVFSFSGFKHWVVFAQITRFLNIKQCIDPTGRCNSSCNHWNMSNGDFATFGPFRVGYWTTTIDNKKELQHMLFDEDKFKRLAHDACPEWFPELDYELDGPEYNKAMEEIDGVLSESVHEEK